MSYPHPLNRKFPSEIDRIVKACLLQVDLAWVPIADISWEQVRKICDTDYVVTKDWFFGSD